MVKASGIKVQKPEKSMFRTNAICVLRQQRLLKYTVVFYCLWLGAVFNAKDIQIDRKHLVYYNVLQKEVDHYAFA